MNIGIGIVVGAGLGFGSPPSSDSTCSNPPSRNRGSAPAASGWGHCRRSGQPARAPTRDISPSRSIPVGSTIRIRSHSANPHGFWAEFFSIAGNRPVQSLRNRKNRVVLVGAATHLVSPAVSSGDHASPTPS